MRIISLFLCALFTSVVAADDHAFSAGATMRSGYVVGSGIPVVRDRPFLELSARHDNGPWYGKTWAGVADDGIKEIDVGIGTVHKVGLWHLDLSLNYYAIRAMAVASGDVLSPIAVARYNASDPWNLFVGIEQMFIVGTPAASGALMYAGTGAKMKVGQVTIVGEARLGFDSTFGQERIRACFPAARGAPWGQYPTHAPRSRGVGAGGRQHSNGLHLSGCRAILVEIPRPAYGRGGVFCARLDCKPLRLKRCLELLLVLLSHLHHREHLVLTLLLDLVIHLLAHLQEEIRVVLEDLHYHVALLRRHVFELPLGKLLYEKIFYRHSLGRLPV